MPTTAQKPASRSKRPARKTTSPKAASVTGSKPSAGRGARRKQATRLRLLKAALLLMADKGADGVAINQITEAADVGFGSFYNYFPSKEAIYDELVTEVVGHYAQALERLNELLSDPAEKLTASLRYSLLRARHDPLWGRFVVRMHLSTYGFTDGLGKYLLQDLASGIAIKRFKVDDLPMTLIAIGGTILSALTTEVELQRPASDENEMLPSMLGDIASIPERVATVLLTMLGLDLAEASEIARRPLPDIELPPNPLA